MSTKKSPSKRRKKKKSEVSKKRLAIFIDGNNFRHGLKAYIKDDHLHWPTFLSELERDYTIIKTTYYIGQVTHPQFEKEIVSEQGKLIRNMKRAGIDSWLGYFNEKKSEKGVDVQIALDIAIGAAEDEYDVGLLISGDGDLIHAINIAKKYKKRLLLGYIAGVKGTSYRISYVLKAKANAAIALNDQVNAAHKKWCDLAKKAGIELPHEKRKKAKLARKNSKSEAGKNPKNNGKKSKKEDESTVKSTKKKGKVKIKPKKTSKIPESPSEILIFSDGASRGNPGHAGCGAMITDKDGKIINKVKKYIGKTTNNQAEYQAILLGLEEAEKMKAKSITCYLDSMLVVNQVTGKWKVKKRELQPLVDKIRTFVAKHPMTSFHHIPREKNKHADKLANEAIDQNY